MSRLMVRNESKKVIAVTWGGILALHPFNEVALDSSCLPISIYLMRGNRPFHLESFTEPFSQVIISDSLIEHEVLIGTIK